MQYNVIKTFLATTSTWTTVTLQIDRHQNPKLHVLLGNMAGFQGLLITVRILWPTVPITKS